MLWVAVALGLLLVGAVVLGFKTRFAKKEQQAQATAAATVAHDAAQSNRTAVRNRAEATPVSTLVGNGQSENGGAAAPGGGVVQAAGNAVVAAVKTDAHPFPNSPGAAVPSPTPVYYYVPPAPQYAAAGMVADDPVRRTRERALERREQAMAARPALWRIKTTV